MLEISLTLQDPEPALSQFPVTNYNLMYASGEGADNSKTLPANATSFDLTVDAGVQYTITVSAFSNGRESQNNPQLNFGMFSACILKDTSRENVMFYFENKQKLKHDYRRRWLLSAAL